MPKPLVDIRRVGFLEVGHTVAFALIVILLYRFLSDLPLLDLTPLAEALIP